MTPSQPKFSSSNVGWSTVGSAAPEGPTNLYRTDDSGKHWKPVLGWDYEEAIETKTSPDGKEVLIISRWGWQGAALFQTSDGGSHWTSFGFPLSAQQAAAIAAARPQTHCKGTILCAQDPGYFPSGQIYFRNPREGWVLTQEPTFGIADLFHTSDSGAHWTLSSRFDIKAQFNLDLIAGRTTSLPPGKGGPVTTHDLQGRLVFQSPSAGWFIPDFSFYSATSLFVFGTLDGGASWKRQDVEGPPGVNSSSGAIVGMAFFNDRQGVLEQNKNLSGQNYVSTTSDGGTSWSHPNLMPTGGNLPDWMDFIDAQNWVAWPIIGGLMRTTDGGQHWIVLTPGLPQPGLFVGRLDFIDLSHGWAYSGYGLFSTIDGGVHWVQVGLPSSG